VANRSSHDMHSHDMLSHDMLHGEPEADNLLTHSGWESFSCLTTASQNLHAPGSSDFCKKYVFFFFTTHLICRMLTTRTCATA
jgi:hypothetical protein